MARIYQQGFEVPIIPYTARAQYNGNLVGDDYINAVYTESEYQSYGAQHYTGVQSDNANGRSGVFKIEYTGGKNSGWWYKFSSSVGINFKKSNEVYVRLYLNFNQLANTTMFECLNIKDADGTTLLKLNAQLIGGSSITISSWTTLQSLNLPTKTIESNKYNKLEIYYKADNTNGIIEFKINNETVWRINGNTIINSNLLNILNIGLISTLTYISNNVSKIFIDDIAINDTTGTINNSWCGSGTIKALIPTANGSLVEFTPNTGTNYSNVDDNGTTDGDTTVNSALEANKTDLFKYTTLSGLQNTAKINAISFTNYIDGQGLNIANVGNINGTTYELATSTPIGGYEYKNTIVELNPATSNKFTVAEINASEFGYRSK